MSEIVLIDIPVSPLAAATWLHYDRNLKHVIARGEVVDDVLRLRELSRQCPVWVVVPSEVAPAYTVTMPTGGTVAKNALPYRLEEQICGELDEQFFASEKIRANTQTLVSVVSKKRLAEWHAWLQTLQIRIKGLAGEALFLPEGCVLDDGARAIVRAGHVAATVDHDNLDDWRALAEASAEDAAKDVAKAPAEVVSTEDRLKSIAELFSAPPHSLLQDQYSVRDPVSAAVKMFRVPAITAGAVVTAWLLFLGADTALTKYRISAMDTAIVDTYRQAFPNARRILSPVKQMKSKLAQENLAGGEGRLLLWLQHVSDSAAAGQNISIDQIQYQSQPENLRVVVKAPAFADGDALLEKLKSKGLDVQRGAFNQQGNQVSGQLTISGRDT